MRRLLAAAILSAMVWTPPLAAQTRVLPERVETGRLAMKVFPEALLDGQPVRLGPGARIHDEANMLVTPGSLVLAGEKDVAFTRGNMGEILRVWILGAEEQRALERRLAEARRRAPAGGTRPAQ